MITTTSLGTITYNFQDNQFQLTDNVDTTKKGEFNLTNVPTSSQVVLNFPSSSGSLIVSGGTSPGSLAFGFSQLSNSTVTITNGNILAGSTIVSCPNNIQSAINIENTGTLYVQSIIPNTSFTINSTKENDNNSFYYIIVY